ncbi:type II secretion system F family protein [Microbacterium plantarum]|uniref:type II secretion system F family protein n=1 Tax=Microbacterium plantarum TaxID=1816425 RepID=UPI002B49D295|nr:type II secretion system F family protein [Microbacterium plantarum]WRK18663.1 type II secretion system F family protein [Microbacterium plantarum]
MTGVSELAIAVVLGTALAAGVLLTISGMPRWVAPPLERRIAPYLRDIADPIGLTPLHAGSSWLAGWRERATRMGAKLGGPVALRRRLLRAGWALTPERFRLRQLLAGVGGLTLGTALTVAVVMRGDANGATLLLPVVLAAAGMLGLHMVLAQAAEKRMRQVREEVPTVLEFLALCLSAGESLNDALRRVSEVGAGELTAHLRAAVLAAGTGSTLIDALRDMARSLDVGSIDRAVDQLVGAIERGAPLAQVLQTQAADAREDAKRVLIEQAGRKEILMLLPLVFLVLPLSVLFAVFPGIVMLRLGL